MHPPAPPNLLAADRQTHPVLNAKHRPHRRLAVVVKALALGLASLLVLSVLLVGALRWMDPPTSAFMLRHWVIATAAGAPQPRVYHEWVPADAIAPAMVLAAIAAEDQRFPEHWGFDFVQLKQAWADFRAGGRLRGASTISQQTAKNLFLWPGRDPVRKALEAWLTLLMEVLWPKQRILEVYLNTAQFGPDTYGVGAAAWRFFDRPAQALSTSQAARLAAVLPNPQIYRIDTPSTTVQRRSRWISQQMRQLGGTSYLHGVWPTGAGER